MRSDWILDVLTDLKTFARANGMPALAEQLDDTAIVAMAEIAAIRNAHDGQRDDGDAAVGNYYGGIGTS
jgi:cytochrome c553